MMIAAFLADLADAAAAAGVTATIAPGRVPPLLSQGAPVLLVDAPTVSMVGLSGRVRVEAPLLLIPCPPGGADDVRAMYAALEALLPTHPGEWRPVQVQLGEMTYPALRATAAATIEKG